MEHELTFEVAGEQDICALSKLRSAVARHLTRDYGRGHWSSEVTEEMVRRGFTNAQIIIARRSRAIVGTLRLVTKKPWAIDVRYFTSVLKPLYLVDMAVAPGMQRQGIGRKLLEHTIVVARTWPSDALRLDAYDAPAGAGPFYTKCGFAEVGRAVYRGTPLLYYERVL